MRKIRIIFIVVLVLGFSAILGIGYLYIAFPKVQDAPDLKIQATPQRLERGKYLANHVTVCIDCHSTRDWTKLSGPVIEGTEGRGGEKFSKEMGFPGTFYAKNITPAALSDWTDGEIYRAITSGVSKDGTPLFPVMPYHDYGKLAKEDIYSIIAYIRTLKPIKNKVKPSNPDFPFSLILRTLPEDQKPAAKVPDKTEIFKYGQYIFTASGCGDCHTPQKNGKPIEEKELAGGFEFPIQGGIVRSANITPDEATGIGSWSKELFVSKFKFFNASGKNIKVSEGGYNTVMPWTMYASMKDEDLKALYEYLQSVKPIHNEVVKFSPKD